MKQHQPLFVGLLLQQPSVAPHYHLNLPTLHSKVWLLSNRPSAKVWLHATTLHTLVACHAIQAAGNVDKGGQFDISKLQTQKPIEWQD